MRILMILVSLLVSFIGIYVAAKFILPAMTPEQHLVLVQIIAGGGTTLSIVAAIGVAIAALIRQFKGRNVGDNISNSSNHESRS